MFGGEVFSLACALLYLEQTKLDKTTPFFAFFAFCSGFAGIVAVGERELALFPRSLGMQSTYI